MLETVCNFFSKIRDEISELRSYDGEIADISAGRMKPEEVIEIALPIAKEKEFVNNDGKPSLTPDKPSLFHYTRRKQLVWSVCFTQYLTEDELNTTYKDFNVKSITFTVVKIDDATGQVISADWIRPHFNQNY